MLLRVYVLWRHVDLCRFCTFLNSAQLAEKNVQNLYKSIRDAIKSKSFTNTSLTIFHHFSLKLVTSFMNAPCSDLLCHWGWFSHIPLFNFTLAPCTHLYCAVCLPKPNLT